MKFQTLLTAISFQRIFDEITPLLEFLEKNVLNLLLAWRLVEKIIAELQCITRGFKTILDGTIKFSKSVNQQHFNYQNLFAQKAL